MENFTKFNDTIDLKNDEEFYMKEREESNYLQNQNLLKVEENNLD